MTIEKLLGYTAAQLEAMSDEELHAHLDKYIKFTRPDMAKMEAQTTSSQTQRGEQKKRFSKEDYMKQQLAKAQALAEQFGLKL